MLVETTELAIVASFLRHRVVTGLCVKYEALATCRTNVTLHVDEVLWFLSFN